MKAPVFLAALCVAAPGLAQNSPAEMTPDQKGYIAYHYCMLHAAIAASRTTAKDEEIYDIAHAQCATTRKAVTAGQEANKPYIAALDAADAEKKANFPSWIKGVRERRAAPEAGN